MHFIFALLLATSARAEIFCESQLVYKAMATELAERLPWKDSRSPHILALAEHLRRNSYQLSQFAKVSRAEVSNFFEVAPYHRNSTEVQKLSANVLQLKWKGRPVVVSRKISEDDHKLIAASFSEAWPREVGQFRFYFKNASGRELFRTSSLILGQTNRVSLGNLETVVAWLFATTADLRTNGLEVTAIEFVHTHHTQTLLFRSGENTGFMFNCPLSNIDGMCDVRLAQEIAQRLGGLHFGITAIMGVAEGDMSKMSFWPSDPRSPEELR